MFSLNSPSVNKMGSCFSLTRGIHLLEGPIVLQSTLARNDVAIAGLKECRADRLMSSASGTGEDLEHMDPALLLQYP